MKLADSAKKFVQSLPSGFRSLRTRALDRLGGNTASNYKYTYHMHVEDFFAFMAAAVGAVALLSPAGLTFGLCALGVAGAIGACRYPSSSKRKAEVIADINAAGQELSGSRADLYRLDLVQQQLNAITKPFNRAAALPEAVAEKTKALIASTEAERGRVKVQGGEPYAFMRAVTRLEKISI
jgi:hypothetical protein